MSSAASGGVRVWMMRRAVKPTLVAMGLVLAALALSAPLQRFLTYPFVLSWSLIEAMSAGCLVVASDTGPLRDVIRPGENGILVPFFDRRALSATIIDALQRPEAYQRLRQGARLTALNAFSRPIVARQLLALLLGTTSNTR